MGKGYDQGEDSRGCYHLGDLDCGESQTSYDLIWSRFKPETENLQLALPTGHLKWTDGRGMAQVHGREILQAGNSDVDLFEPITEEETRMGLAMQAFCTYVLEERRQESLELILDHLGDSVGELQGGSNEHEIYRLSMENTDSNSTNTAASQLLDLFHKSSRGRRYAKVITIPRLFDYILGMCRRRYENRRRQSVEAPVVALANVMFILSFGATHGQVRHIDQMHPNLQIGCYLSPRAPATRVYRVTDDVVVDSVHDLLDVWREDAIVPPLVASTLIEYACVPLGNDDDDDDDAIPTSVRRRFAHWGSLHLHLQVFGKLYLPIAHEIVVQDTRPGTTLLAPGNEIHAGPPTSGPRLLVLAVGITESSDQPREDDKNGEQQYNLVLLHVELCCILFALWDDTNKNHQSKDEEQIREAKLFLLRLLEPMILEYPDENYWRLFGDDQRQLREWLAQYVTAITTSTGIVAERLYTEATCEDSAIFGASVKQRRGKAKKQRKKERREQCPTLVAGG